MYRVYTIHRFCCFSLNLQSGSTRSLESEIMGSLHDTVTWYEIRLLDGKRMQQPPKESDFDQPSVTFLCFLCPSASLPSSRTDFMACDSFMQRAHFLTPSNNSLYFSFTPPLSHYKFCHSPVSECMEQV